MILEDLKLADLGPAAATPEVLGEVARLLTASSPGHPKGCNGRGR